MGLMLGPHARTDRTQNTRVAEPRLPAPEDGRPGEGQRLTPDAPHNGGGPPPQGTAPHHPRGTQPPQGMQAKGTVLGPHTRTPAPTAHGWRTPTARPEGGQSGEGERLTSDAPHNGERHPPGDAPPPPPQRATPARKGARCGAGAGSPRPHRPHPGHTGRGTPAARPRGRAAGRGTAPDARRPSQRWQATPPRDGPPPLPRHAAPTGHAGQGDSAGPPHPQTRAHSTWVADPNSPAEGRAVGGGETPDLGRPSQRRRAPPRGRPSATPTANSASPQGRTRCGAGAGSTRSHQPHPGHTDRGTPPPLRHAAPHKGKQAKGTALGPHTRTPATTTRGQRAPAEGGQPESAQPRTPLAAGSPRTAGGEHLMPTRTHERRPVERAYELPNPPRPQHVHQPREIRTLPPALRHSDTTMAEPAAPRKTRPRSPTLDAAHEVIRALGLRSGEDDPPQEDAGADSDLEEIPGPPASSTPAEPAPLAGSVPTLCPAWKRGHCTGEGWCPKQHPQPGPDDGALPAVGPAAARAALRYGVAQGWILDETARGSVNIQEAVDRVAHAGQAAVALHTRGRHGGPAEGIIVEPSGMVLVLAADMVRGVLHASRVRRARPQWTIQVYTPPRAWPFSTWAVLAVMWHLAPEDAPTGTAEDIARDLHTWPAGQDFPWRRPRGGLPVAPAAEGLSLAATLQRHPDKRARHFLQTGTVPAAPPDSEWRWDAGEAQPLPGPWVLPLWYLPVGSLAHAAQAVKGAFPQPLLPGVALLRSLQAGAAWVRWREQDGSPSPYFPLVQGQALLHAEGMGTVEWGVIVPDTVCRWITAAAPQPMRSPPACHRLLRAVPSLAPQHALTMDMWRAMLSHTKEWLTNPGTRYPPEPVLEQLTAPHTRKPPHPAQGVGPYGTPALLPAQGRQRDGTRQGDPPPHWPPRPHSRKARRTGRPPPPPPPHPAPRRRDAPGAQTHPAGSAQPQARKGGNGTGPPPPPSTPNGARDRGRTRGGARTAWNGPTSAQHRDRAKCAHHTNRGRGGEGSGRRESASAHTHKGHAGNTRRATGPSPQNAQTAWNGVPASEGKGHPDGMARHTQRRTRGAGRGNRGRQDTRNRPEPPELAASAAHTRPGHCTRQGSSGAPRHAPAPRLGSLRASPRGSHWRQASSTGPAAPTPRATMH